MNDWLHIRRFSDELRVAASIRSVHIARVQAWDYDDGAGPYIVLERLPGGTLEELLRAKGALGRKEQVSRDVSAGELEELGVPSDLCRPNLRRLERWLIPSLTAGCLSADVLRAYATWLRKGKLRRFELASSLSTIENRVKAIEAKPDGRALPKLASCPQALRVRWRVLREAEETAWCKREAETMRSAVASLLVGNKDVVDRARLVQSIATLHLAHMASKKEIV